MSLEAWLEFRSGEQVRDVRLTCVLCGKEAEGEVSLDAEPCCNACSDDLDKDGE